MTVKPMRSLRNPGQDQFGSQAANRRIAERQVTSIKTRKIDYDRESQARTRLGLIEPLPAPRSLLAFRRRKPASIVVDNDPQPCPVAALRRSFGQDLDGHPRGCPFAGIVYEVAYHLLQILPFATKPCRRISPDLNGDSAISMNFLHCPAQSFC